MSLSFPGPSQSPEDRSLFTFSLVQDPQLPLPVSLNLARSSSQWVAATIPPSRCSCSFQCVHRVLDRLLILAPALKICQLRLEPAHVWHRCDEMPQARQNPQQLDVCRLSDSRQSSRSFSRTNTRTEQEERCSTHLAVSSLIFFSKSLHRGGRFSQQKLSKCYHNVNKQ